MPSKEQIILSNDQINVITDYLIKTNLKPIIIAVSIIAIAIIVVIFILARKIMTYVTKVRELDIGPFKIRNYDENGTEKQLKKKEIKHLIHQNELISVNTFINILDAILSTKLHHVIKSCIESSDKIHRIYTEYDELVASSFDRIFHDLKNEYYNTLIVLAMKVRNMDRSKIHYTPEYLFITDVLNEFEKRWKSLSKDITRRNGFVEFSSNPEKAQSYIQELKRCIYHCIDSSKLDITAFDREMITNSFDEVGVIYSNSIENMFMDLSAAKVKMFAKRDYELKQIDNITTETVTNILNDLMTKILGTAKPFAELKIESEIDETTGKTKPNIKMEYIASVDDIDEKS